MNLKDMNSVASCKSDVMRIFTRGNNFVEGDTYNVELLMRRALGDERITIEGDGVKFQYLLDKQCEDRSHQTIENGERNLGLIESTYLEGTDKVLSDSDVPTLLNNYWSKRFLKCGECHQNLKCHRNFINTPVLVTISRGDSNCFIDDIIEILKVRYRLFAVCYMKREDSCRTDEAHYIALIREDETIYTYDGLVKNGKLCVDEKYNGFKKEYRDKRTTLTATLLMYKIEDISRYESYQSYIYDL